MQKSKIFLVCALLSTSILFGGCATNSPSSGDAKQSSSEAAVETKAGNPPSIRVSSPDAANASESVIASDSNGNVYVVWVEHGANKTADVYLQKFDGAAQPIGERTRINPEAGRATAWRGDPPTVATGADGAIYIGWTARVEVSEGSANDLYLSKSVDGGRTFDAPVKVNDDPIPAVHGMHSLAVDKDNRVYFAWLDERYLKDQPKPSEMSATENNSGEMKHRHGEPNREVYFAASTDGGKTFSKNKKLASNVCPCCKTSTLAAPSGGLYVSWRQVLEGDFRHIAVASSTNKGESFGAPVIVSDDKWQINGCPVSGAALAAGAGDTLKVAWFTAGASGAPGLYWAESKDGGRSFSPRKLLSETPVSGTPQLSSGARNNYRVVWSAGGKLYEREISDSQSSDGKPVELGDGELPSAVMVGSSELIAYDEKKTDRRGIRLICLKGK